MQRIFNRHTRILIALLLIVLAAYIADVPFRDPPEPPGMNGFYRVMQVTDGDTISILKDGTRESVRLIGIDSPEVETRYTKMECFGNEASKAARELLADKTVRIETDATQQLHDAYDRLLAYVYLPADDADHPGVLANEYLVREGFAREYTYKKPYLYQATFKSGEQEARVAKKGLWAACPTS